MQCKRVTPPLFALFPTCLTDTLSVFFWRNFSVLSHLSPCGIVAHLDCPLLSWEYQRSTVSCQPFAGTCLELSHGWLQNSQWGFTQSGSWHGFKITVEKLIVVIYFDAFLSYAVLDNFTETQQHSIIANKLLLFRTCLTSMTFHVSSIVLFTVSGHMPALNSGQRKSLYSTLHARNKSYL